MKTFTLFLLLLVAFAFGSQFDDFSFNQPARKNVLRRRAEVPTVPNPDDKGVNYYFPTMQPSENNPERVPFVSRLDIQQPGDEVVTLSFNLTEMQQNQLIDNGQHVVLLGEMISMSISGGQSDKLDELSVFAMVTYLDREGNPVTSAANNDLWEIECDDSTQCSERDDMDGKVAVNCDPDLGDVVQLSILVSSTARDDDDDYKHPVSLASTTLSYSIAVGYVYGTCQFPLAGLLFATFWFLLFTACFWSISACFICCWYKKRKAAKKVKKAQVTFHEKDEIPLVEAPAPVEAPVTAPQQPQIQYVPVYIPVPQQQQQQQQQQMQFFPQQPSQQPYIPLYPAYTQHQ